MRAYPETRHVAVFLSKSSGSMLTGGDILDGGDVLPGFSVPVQDIFA